MNVVGLIILTNYRTDAVYLPPDDRRTFVVWSQIPERGLTEEKSKALWGYYANGGFADIAAYFRQYDLSRFDPYAAPLKTDAFWAVVGAHRPAQESELMDVLEQLGKPPAVTLDQIKTLSPPEIVVWMNEPKNHRAIPHRLEGCGYLPQQGCERWLLARQRQATHDLCSTGIE